MLNADRHALYVTCHQQLTIYSAGERSLSHSRFWRGAAPTADRRRPAPPARSDSKTWTAPGDQEQLSRTPLNDLVTAAASGLEAHALWRAHTRLQLARRGKLAPVLQMGDLKPNDVGTLPRGLIVLGVINDERAIISTDSGRLVWCVRMPTADLEDGQLLEDSRVFRVTGKYRYQRQLGDYVTVWELSPQ